MDRRRFVVMIAGALVAPLAGAQQKEIARIGVLATSSFFVHRVDAFRVGMRDLGYAEGKNLVYVYRNAEGKFDRLPDLAAELARSNVDLIFTASAEAVLAAMKATSTIPIVFGSVQDPVASGIAASLAQPGRNATGMSAVAPDLGRKRLQLLREASPGLVRVGYLWSPASKGSDIGLKEAQAASRSLGLQLHSLEVSEPGDLERALEASVKQRVQGLLTAPDPMINALGARVIEFAAGHRLPAMYAAPEHVDAGGLMTYAPNYGDLWRRAAATADKILKGAKPAGIPVEQPTRFELIVNLKAAKAIGLAVPQTILFRADRVIE